MTKIQDLCGFYTITNTKQNGKETASNIYIYIKNKNKTKEEQRRVYIPGSDMGFRREDSESRTLVLGSDLVVSELLHEFGPSYHFSWDRRSF